MLRRNFLRNAAFTLPVALVAPEALLASNSTKKAGIIIVGTGAATLQVADQLAADKADILILEAGSQIVLDSTKATTLTRKQVTKVHCNKQGFLLTDDQGNSYSSTKLIFAGTASFCDNSAKVYVQASDARQLTLSIKRNGPNSATCWAVPNNQADPYLLSSFINSNKVAFMCLS